MEELGIPDLTTEQTEMLCATAESTARKYILSQVPAKMVERLGISVEALGTKPLSITVEIDLELSLRIKGFDADKLVNEGVKEAHKASENYLRKLK